MQPSATFEPDKMSAMQRNALIRQGEVILKKNPRNKEMLAQLGALYLANGDTKTAIDHLKAAHKLDKKDVKIIAHLVNAHNDVRLFETGKKYARKLVEIAPREGEFLRVYAMTLELCGQYEKALEVWQRLIRLQPGSALPLSLMAKSLRTMGRMEEALQWFDKVQEVDPLNAEALYMSVQSRRVSAEEVPELLERIEQAAAKSEHPIEKANLYFAAGKILADIGKTDEAFKFYRQANELRLDEDTEARLASYNDALKKTRNAIAVYDRALFSAKTGMGNPWDAPIFILGMPRSGTTLTESLVAGHSQVIAGDELGYMGKITASIGLNSSEPEAISKLLQTMNADDLKKTAELYKDSTAGIWKKNTYFTDKMPHNYQSMGMIRLLFPNAKIIHCRRHPIDNCLSIYTNSMNDSHNRYKSDLPTLGLYYRQYLRLMQHWREVLPGGFHEVFYEDMVANTEFNARAIMDYLGLEWEEAIMERQGSQKHVRTLSAWQVRQPVYTSSAGRWRKFEKHLNPLIEALGPSVSEYEAQLAALDRGSRVMITIQQAAGMDPNQRKLYLGKVDEQLAKNPRNFDALLSGAALHYADQNLMTCADLLNQAHQVNKKDKAVLTWMAIAQMDTNQIRPALASSEKLLRLAPDEPNSWDTRGKVLDLAGKPAEALAAFEKVREMAGPNPELELLIANSHFYLGNHDAAAETYLRLTEMVPQHALGLYGYSTVHTFDAGEADNFLEKIEAAIPLNKNMPDHFMSALHYAAAKACSDAKRHDEAFSYFIKANDVRRPSNSDALAQPFEASRMAFPAAFFEDKKEWGDRTASPIFIVGMPRSGTTLVESIVGAHKAVTSGGELPFMDAIAMNLGSMSTPQDYARNIASLSRKDVAEHTRKYLTDSRAMAGTTGTFTDKMPHNFMNIGLIFLLFPKARIINCLRHPLDNCVSIYTNAMTPAHSYYKSDLATLGTYYTLYEDIMAHWHDIFPGRILDMRYEDMISNTELNAREIMTFLNLPWQEEVRRRQQSQKAVRTLSAWQVRQPIYQSSLGRWRIYKSHLGALIDKLGESVERYEVALGETKRQDVE